MTLFGLALDTVSGALTSAAAVTDTFDVAIKINDQPLVGEAAAAVLDFSINHQVGQAAQLTIRLAAWDSDAEELTWADDETFAPGGWIAVSIHVQGTDTLLFGGDISSLELEASTSERAVLTVHAYDVLHRLGRGQRSQPYPNSSYGDIASTIAKRYTLSANVTSGPDDPVNGIVYQRSTSDLQFLLGLADQIAYELYADGKALVFRPSRIGSPQPTLDAAVDLVQFSAQLQAADQFGGVDVIGFDSNAKQRITASADNAATTDGRFGGVISRVIREISEVTQEEANARRDAELQRIRERYLTANATSFGRPDLRPGVTISIANLGARFGGAYYIESVHHSVSAGGGFRTQLQLRGQPSS
jgi:phage protein D